MSEEEKKSITLMDRVMAIVNAINRLEVYEQRDIANNMIALGCAVYSYCITNSDTYEDGVNLVNTVMAKAKEFAKEGHEREQEKEKMTDASQM